MKKILLAVLILLAPIKSNADEGIGGIKALIGTLSMIWGSGEILKHKQVFTSFLKQAITNPNSQPGVLSNIGLGKLEKGINCLSDWYLDKAIREAFKKSIPGICAVSVGACLFGSGVRDIKRPINEPKK